MVATNARGGVIAFGAVILGLGYFGIKSKETFKKLISLLIIVAAIAGIIVFAPSVFKERAATIADYQHQGTATARIEYWKLGIKMFLSNPIIGVGAGNYPERYWDFGGWEKQWRVAHNMYIEALSELGILGFGCLFFLLYFTFKDGLFTYQLLRKNNKTNTYLYSANQGAIVSLFAYCVGGMFQSLFTYPMLYMLIAIVVACKNIGVGIASPATFGGEARNDKKKAQ
jgi:O-antigen ligase